MTSHLEILVCTIDEGINKIPQLLCQPVSFVSYLVSWQQSVENVKDIPIPEELAKRNDVKIITINGKGLSANRNLALEKATSELVMFVDDDTHIEKEAFDVIFQLFDENKDLDIAFFQASTYNGVLLKPYPIEETVIDGMPENYA